MLTVYVMYITFTILYFHALYCNCTTAYTADNQILMANEGAIDCLIDLLASQNELIQRQSAKALANLGVSAENKPRIASAGGIPKLIALAGTPIVAVKIEAIAALANLAVNGRFPTCF